MNTNKPSSQAYVGDAPTLLCPTQRQATLWGSFRALVQTHQHRVNRKMQTPTWPLPPSEVIISNPEVFEQKRRKIVAGGADHLQIIADFDRTLSTAYLSTHSCRFGPSARFPIFSIFFLFSVRRSRRVTSYLAFCMIMRLTMSTICFGRKW